MTRSRGNVNGQGVPEMVDTRWRMRPHPKETVRDIMDTLDEAKSSSVTHPWGGHGLVTIGKSTRTAAVFTAAGWELVGEWTYRLPDTIYDLRTSQQYLAEQNGRLTDRGTAQEGFRVSFSRSVRLLCEAGVLICEAPDLPNLSERRFVRRGQDAELCGK